MLISCNCEPGLLGLLCDAWHSLSYFGGNLTLACQGPLCASLSLGCTQPIQGNHLAGFPTSVPPGRTQGASAFEARYRSMGGREAGAGRRAVSFLNAEKTVSGERQCCGWWQRVRRGEWWVSAVHIPPSTHTPSPLHGLHGIQGAGRPAGRNPRRAPRAQGLTPRLTASHLTARSSPPACLTGPAAAGSPPSRSCRCPGQWAWEGRTPVEGGEERGEGGN